MQFLLLSGSPKFSIFVLILYNKKRAYAKEAQGEGCVAKIFKPINITCRITVTEALSKKRCTSYACFTSIRF
jgi:hypothetical protein